MFTKYSPYFVLIADYFAIQQIWSFFLNILFYSIINKPVSQIILS